jgi:hypothetical protein
LRLGLLRTSAGRDEQEQSEAGSTHGRQSTPQSPPDVGKWKVDEESPAAAAVKVEGLQREVRLRWDPDAGFLHRGKLVRQVRYRRLETRAIERSSRTRRSSSDA